VALIVHQVRTRLVHDDALVILHARDDLCPGDPQLWALVEQVWLPALYALHWPCVKPIPCRAVPCSAWARTRGCG
jgi:hypothetical protein